MKLGLFVFPTFASTPEAAIDCAVENGLYSIELVWGMFNRLNTKEEIYARAAEIKRYADERGVVLRTFSHGIDMQTDQASKVELLKLMADICRITDCKYLHHTLAFSFHPKDQKDIEEVLPVIIPACREVYDYAAAQGVQVVYEPQGMVVNGVKNLLRFSEALERDAKYVADLGNTFFVNEKPDGVIRALAGKIAHVHVKDYHAVKNLSEIPLPYAFGYSQERAAAFYSTYCYPTPDGTYLADAKVGSGANDFTALFAALIEQGYDGCFHLEVNYNGKNEKEDFATTLAYCRARYEEAKAEVCK